MTALHLVIMQKDAFFHKNRSCNVICFSHFTRASHSWKEKIPLKLWSQLNPTILIQPNWYFFQLLLFYTVRHAELASKRNRLFLQTPLPSFKKQYQPKSNHLAQILFHKETELRLSTVSFLYQNAAKEQKKQQKKGPLRWLLNKLSSDLTEGSDLNVSIMSCLEFIF